ncbi:hypothetical protein SMSP2_01053 [Limihaloglobus sulfuriphilus]|uniref:Uncharacterized protein n=2 Tax=Limihaloglobus sulfuriphilus TaxID=1851148 RepID=A0A1Q2MDD4_9BACT|nr:hypothetical protein SMSP2_01053 [Limihaloglobus sulfuriphilus]
MAEFMNCLAGIKAPLDISTNPYTLLWILPLLLLISITYRTIKIDSFDIKKIIVESAKMFTLTILAMAAITAILWTIVNYAT